MSLFDKLVSEALLNQKDLASRKIVVEKELLHHDILREMGLFGLLNKLTFIGGTCLRTCYGSNRLSEDLDFSGGKEFKREILDGFGAILSEHLHNKYELQIEVSEPNKESGNVDTWKIRVVTQPLSKDIPAQKIHIDICAVPSYDRKPMILQNHYGVDMGTSSLILQAESREEIFADKLVAFSLRPNRLKNRDLWDIVWLKQQGVTLPIKLIPEKIHDHGRGIGEFSELMNERSRLIVEDPSLRDSFIYEMKRFLPPKIVKDTVENKDFWIYLSGLIRDECSYINRFLNGESEKIDFKM